VSGRLEGKVIAVTGGASGIGAAICRRTAQEGAAVGILDIQAAAAKALAAELRDAGLTARSWALDVTVEAEVQRVLHDVAQAFGRLDVLVNNAGIPGTGKRTHEVTEDEYDAVFDVNAKGVFLCTKHALAHMRPRRSGSIINMSSVNGIVGNADVPIYHATKAAVRLMAKTDAVLYGPEGIRVNAIHPGPITTPLGRRVAERWPGGPEAYEAMWAQTLPIGRRGDPDDIAWGVVYLASDEARFVTGAELVIDGGYTAQ
jgi:NAD(P)-dependent dehydrogenase (short-subunit alcohol dehydrogenase family)